MKTIFSIYENLSMGGVPAVMRQRARWTEHAATNVFYHQNDRGGLNAMRGIGNLHVYVGIQNHQTNIEQIAARYRPDKIFLYSHYHLGSLLRAYCSEIYFEYHRSDTTSVQSLLKYARSATQIHVPTLWSKRFIEQNSRDPISTKIEIVPNVIDRPGLEDPGSPPDACRGATSSGSDSSVTTRTSPTLCGYSRVLQALKTRRPSFTSS